MATQAEIKKTILRVAGNPVSGPIADLADDFATAIFELDEKPRAGKKAEPERRIYAVDETR